MSLNKICVFVIDNGSYLRLCLKVEMLTSDASYFSNNSIKSPCKI